MWSWSRSSRTCSSLLSRRELIEYIDPIHIPHGKSAAILFPDPDFFQRIEHILRMTSDWTSAKKDVLNFLQEYREYDSPKSSSSSKIEEAERMKMSNEPVFIYSCGTLVSNHVNRALRSQSMLCISKLQCYIRALDVQLRKLNQEQINNTDFENVYRGKPLTPKECYFYREHIGKYITYNTYQSTSRDEEFARDITKSVTPHTPPEGWQHEFEMRDNAKTARSESDLTEKSSELNWRLQNTSTMREVENPKYAVLFHIEIPPDVRSEACFADISEHSCFPDEKEVLFARFNVFRIDKVSPGEDMLIIKLRVAEKHNLFKELIPSHAEM
jgi:hypothetical protein